jgi:hypothetical protein
MSPCTISSSLARATAAASRSMGREAMCHEPICTISSRRKSCPRATAAARRRHPPALLALAFSAEHTAHTQQAAPVHRTVEHARLNCSTGSRWPGARAPGDLTRPDRPCAPQPWPRRGIPGRGGIVGHARKRTHAGRELSPSLSLRDPRARRAALEFPRPVSPPPPYRCPRPRPHSSRLGEATRPGRGRSRPARGGRK